MNLTTEQIEILEKLDFKTITNEDVIAISDESRAVSLLSTEDLIEFVKIANALYRAGHSVIDDNKYDFYFISELKKRDSNLSFLNTVEPEPEFEFTEKTVALPARMLSTDKAYSIDEIKKWITRLEKAATEIDLDPTTLEIRVTPKLDGYAAYDDGHKLYTRGDGVRGADVSRVFERGVVVFDDGARGQGPGEIVVKKSYFETYLSEHFENSRNIQAAILAPKKVNETVQYAIDSGAVVFCPFAQLQSWVGNSDELLANFDEITTGILESQDFDVDGVVLEAVNHSLKESMGATRHHHRWQIALKANLEKAEVRVINVIPQTSRTGRINPVAELEPTKLSGAMISRVTVHHYGMVKAKGIGSGALIELVRSGLVIPKIESVIEAVEPVFPKTCPSCGSDVVWDKDNLECTNKTNCPAQAEETIIYFFTMLGNIDGFGPSTISKLYNAGVKTIHEIYQMTVSDFEKIEFGEKTSQNLVHQLAASRAITIEDWRFLAAFGVFRLGRGNCERLLQHYPLESIFDLTVDQIVQIDGFAEISAEIITQGLAKIKDEFFSIFGLGFKLEITPLIINTLAAQSPIAGKQIVFTGSMALGSRSDMEKEAKKLGAKVAKSVSSKTNYLVTGAKVGVNKINGAKEKGVDIITEEEYLRLLGK